MNEHEIMQVIISSIIMQVNQFAAMKKCKVGNGRQKADQK